MNWLFIVITLLFFYCLYKGYRKGLLRMVYAVVSWAIMLAIVSVGTPYVNDYLTNHTGLYTLLAEQFEDRLQESVEQAGQQHLDAASQSEMQQLEAMGIKVPESLLENIVDFSSDTANEFLAQGGVYSNIAQSLAAFTVKGIATLLTWIFAALVVSLIAHILGIVSRIPILRGVNKYLGVAAGAVYALLLVWTLFGITALCAGSELGRTMIGLISQNRILTYLYNNNVVLIILYRML